MDAETVAPKVAKELLARVIVGMLNDRDEGIINAAVTDWNSTVVKIGKRYYYRLEV